MPISVRSDVSPRDAVAAALERLSPAERRVAEVVMRDPEGVAFGTVVAVAARARTSGPSVVRLADRLGYRGFVGCRRRWRDLRGRLRPAVERVRTRPRPTVSHVLATELDNLRQSLEGLDRGAFDAAVARLADSDHRVTVIASEQARAATSSPASSRSCATASAVVDGSNSAS
jgi:DNA-binding MurR/RpiR family transcriptional regulator